MPSEPVIPALDGHSVLGRTAFVAPVILNIYATNIVSGPYGNTMVHFQIETDGGLSMGAVLIGRSYDEVDSLLRSSVSRRGIVTIWAQSGAGINHPNGLLPFIGDLSVSYL